MVRQEVLALTINKLPFMYRKFTTIAILTGMLVNQSIVWGHSHAGMSEMDSREHDSRPHVHLHSHDDNHHHGHKKVAGDEDRAGSVIGLVAAEPSDRHDCGALFLPGFEIVTGEESTSQQLNAKLLKALPALVIAAEIDGLFPASSLSLLRGKSVSLDSQDCPLYLRTLSLRL